jgi:ATP-dependent DNA ligase
MLHSGRVYRTTHSTESSATPSLLNQPFNQGNKAVHEVIGFLYYTKANICASNSSHPMRGYVARTRVGFTPASRERLMAKLRPLEIPEYPFANLPEGGEGLTAEKMKECVWVRPELVAEVEFVEWTPEGKLRHARFVGMKDG